MKNKKRLSVVIVYLIILVAFNVIYFFIPFPEYASGWVCYGFSTLSVIVSCALSLWAFTRDEPLKSKIYGYPIFRIGIVYISAQFAFTITILSISFGVEVPAWIAVVVSAVNLSYVLIGTIVNDTARDVIIQQDTELVHTTKKMTLFKIDMSYVVDMCTDPSLKKQLNSLLEDFRYSDPVSSPELEDIENTIRSEVDELYGLVNVDNKCALEKAALISRLLADRNRRCKAFKQ